MAFLPQANQQIEIDSLAYRIAEHPAAPGMPYGQEGRQATVYQLIALDGEKRALKVFKPRFRAPALVSIAERQREFARLPGLAVCARTVLTPELHAPLLRQISDLTYAVLMPWIEGPTWMQVLLEKQKLAPETCLHLARTLTQILSRMEQEGLAHCDLSGANVLLPALAPNSAGQLHAIGLVDVEQMYSSEMRRPSELPGGSPGYAHKTAPAGLWSLDADRFAGTLLIVELLGWCDERVRAVAWSESYFDPNEMQQDSERYKFLCTVLKEHWGEGVSHLFERAWHSSLLNDCATFGEWLVALPERVLSSPLHEETTARLLQARRLTRDGKPTDALALYRDILARLALEDPLRQEIVKTIQALDEHLAAPSPLDVASILLAKGQRLEQEGDNSAALAAYQEAMQRAKPGTSLHEELELIVRELERTVGAETQLQETARQAVALEQQGRWQEAAGAYQILANQAQEPSKRDEWVHSAHRCEEEAALSSLFDDAVVAYRGGEWARAKELLTEVVRRRPEYVREGQAAEVLLKGIRGSPNLFLIGSILVVALVLILLSGAAIFTLALGPTETPIPTRTRVAIAVRTPTPTLTDTPTPTITETSTPLPTRTVFLPIPTRRSPVPAAVSPTVPPTRSSTLPPIEWDSRLGPGGIPGLASIRIIPANVGRGQKFWRVTKVTAEENEGGITGDHALYISVVDELGNRANGKKLRITGEYTKSSEFLEEKSPYDVCRCNFNYQVYGDNMSVIIEGDQYPSEAVAGIHQLEPNRWFKFFVTFKLSSNP